MFFGASDFFRFWSKNPETDRDDTPGEPRFVIPVRFGVFWPKNTKNNETDWDDNPGKPRLVIPIRFEKSRLGPKNIPNGYFYKKNSTAELEVQLIVFL